MFLLFKIIIKISNCLEININIFSLFRINYYKFWSFSKILKIKKKIRLNEWIKEINHSFKVNSWIYSFDSKTYS